METAPSASPLAVDELREKVEAAQVETHAEASQLLEARQQEARAWASVDAAELAASEAAEWARAVGSSLGSGRVTLGLLSGHEQAAKDRTLSLDKQVSELEQEVRQLSHNDDPPSPVVAGNASLSRLSSELQASELQAQQSLCRIEE